MDQSVLKQEGHTDVRPTYYEMRDKVFKRLREIGITSWGLLKTESNYLPTLIHPDETIMGAVFGRGRNGLILIIATDTRMLLVDTKPLFTKVDEISYDTITGLSWEWVAFSGILVMHAQPGDIRVRVYNRKAAQNLVECLEERCIEHHDSDRNDMKRFTPHNFSY